MSYTVLTAYGFNSFCRSAELQRDTGANLTTTRFLIAKMNQLRARADHFQFTSAPEQPQHQAARSPLLSPIFAHFVTQAV